MKPAARVGDMHTCPRVNPGPVPHVGGPILPPSATTVTIAGMPAARVGDRALCVGPPDTIAMGSMGVFIQGKPAARLGDPTAHGGVIIVGCPTVLIGDICGGAGSLQGLTMSAARAAGAPFTKARCDGAPVTSPPKPHKPRRPKLRPARQARAAPIRVEAGRQARKFWVGIQRLAGGTKRAIGRLFGYDPERGQLLKQALADQARMLDQQKAELERWDEPAKQNFEKWFGTREETARKTIMGRIDRTRELNRAYDIKQFKQAPPWKPDTWFAYVMPNDEKRRIYLGKAFDSASATGKNSKAGTLSHEMSHFVGIGDTDDHAYGVVNCKQLAKLDPALALENADSFEYYLENVP